MFSMLKCQLLSREYRIRKLLLKHSEKHNRITAGFGAIKSVRHKSENLTGACSFDPKHVPCRPHSGDNQIGLIMIRGLQPTLTSGLTGHAAQPSAPRDNLPLSGTMSMTGWESAS